jgi:hypothetical protein
VWNFFVKGTDENNKDIAGCPACPKKLSACSSGGTSHLWRHKCYKVWEALHATPPSIAPPPLPLSSPHFAASSTVLPAAADDDEDTTIYGYLSDLDGISLELL